MSADVATVLKEKGWRVEVFWNGGGDWFTARLVSRFDRFGNAVHPVLLPIDGPIGASAPTPEGALANLRAALDRLP